MDSKGAGPDLRGAGARAPILIGGCARSGTTLVKAVLAASPSIYAIEGETRVFCPYAYLLVNEDVTRTDPDCYAAGRYRELVDASIESHRARAREVIDTMRSQGCARWVEKTPKNVLFFDEIRGYFDGHVRMINIVRDGRDVITSRHPLAPDRYWVKPERWIADVEAGLRFESLPEVLTIRYEDLVRDYDAVIARIMDFLDEPPHPNMLDWTTHTAVQASGAWQEGRVRNLSARSIGRHCAPEHTAVVTALESMPRAAALLRHYGYV